jgi:GDP-L-fucose synthase
MSYWSDKRVLVTGGGGFLGSVVCDKLAGRGAGEVIAVRSADYDLTTPDSTAKLFADTDPDIVIHLAARVGGIGANMARPAELYLANLLMGTYVIEEARRRSTDKVVVIGTICSYPKFATVPFSEDGIWDGYPEETNAPYGVAKKALLVHAQANAAQYGQNIVYLLPTNLYGPADNFDPAWSHVIPALIKRFVEAEEEKAASVTVWGTGEATREFLYVDDAAEGIVAASEAYDSPEPVNLGSGEEISIRDLAGKIAAATGFSGELEWDQSKPDGQPRRLVDTTRARQRFGFEAKVGLDEGLRSTVSWFLDNRPA